MRILYLTTYYLPHSSGITAYLHCVARALAQRGHTVTVLTSRHDPALSDDESLDGVRIIRLPVLFRVSKGPVMPTFFWSLHRYLQTHDVVHIHLPFLESADVTGLDSLVITVGYGTCNWPLYSLYIQ